MNPLDEATDHGWPGGTWLKRLPEDLPPGRLKFPVTITGEAKPKKAQKMIFPNIEYEQYFTNPWVVAQATEIRDSKVRSKNTKSLNGGERTPEKIYEDSLRGLAMECALFEFLTEYGKNKGWVVKRSEYKSHDLELTIGRQFFRIDVKTIFESRKGKTLSISPFEMRMARDDTLYLIFDVELGEAMFVGWVEKIDFRASKFNDGGYVFWTDVNLSEEDLPFR